MRTAIILLLGITIPLVFAPGCGAYGTSEQKEPVSSAAVRSVKCGALTCTGDQICCLDGNSNNSCAASCSTTALTCDDGSDCAGLFCCIDVVVNSDGSAAVKGSTCRTASDCRSEASPSGHVMYRGCDPVTVDCSGKGCASLASHHTTIFPSAPLYVCD